jgi:hypothetical protein
MRASDSGRLGEVWRSPAQVLARVSRWHLRACNGHSPPAAFAARCKDCLSHCPWDVPTWDSKGSCECATHCVGGGHGLDSELRVGHRRPSRAVMRATAARRVPSEPLLREAGCGVCSRSGRQLATRLLLPLVHPVVGSIASDGEGSCVSVGNWGLLAVAGKQQKRDEWDTRRYMSISFSSLPPPAGPPFPPSPPLSAGLPLAPSVRFQRLAECIEVHAPMGSSSPAAGPSWPPSPPLSTGFLLASSVRFQRLAECIEVQVPVGSSSPIAGPP